MLHCQRGTLSNMCVFLLSMTGEHMTEEDVAECFTILLGLNEEEEEEEGARGGGDHSEHDILKSECMWKKNSLTNQNLRIHTTAEKTSPIFDVCFCPGGDPKYSLELAIPVEISMETFTGYILGFPSSAEQRGSSSPPE